jgi:hypothetical protein
MTTAEERRRAWTELRGNFFGTSVGALMDLLEPIAFPTEPAPTDNDHLDPIRLCVVCEQRALKGLAYCPEHAPTDSDEESVLFKRGWLAGHKDALDGEVIRSADVRRDERERIAAEAEAKADELWRSIDNNTPPGVATLMEAQSRELRAFAAHLRREGQRG